MDIHPHLTAAAQSINSTLEELSSLGMSDLVQGLTSCLLNVADARTRLAERRRIAELLAHPHLSVEEQFTERGYATVECADLAHGDTIGSVYSPAIVRPTNEPAGLAALLSHRGESVEFRNLDEVHYALAVLNDIAPWWVALTPSSRRTQPRASWPRNGPILPFRRSEDTTIRATVGATRRGS